MTSTASAAVIETIVLDKGDAGLGFNIRGGLDNVHVEGDPGVFVTTIKMNGAAAKDGRLQPGDKLLEINGNDLRCVQHHKAVDFFHAAGNEVTLLVERGAEQRIISSKGQAQAVRMGYSDTTIAKDDQTKRSWLWVPLTIVIGGSAVVLLYLYLRKRRQ